MLDSELARKPYVKAFHNKRLQELTGRSKGSIEFKFQNISAALERLCLPWIDGYKPMANYQKALIGGIERFLSRSNSEAFSIFEPKPIVGLSEGVGLFYSAAPDVLARVVVKSDPLQRLVRKFDPAVRDERNRTLGRMGEELVLRAEHARLVPDYPNLAKRIRWISEEDGDGAGYDILSFEPDGRERLIEVKTTVGHQRTPFFISKNEVSLSKERPDHFRLARVFDFLKEPKAFELSSNELHAMTLTPENYRASF